MATIFDKYRNPDTYANIQASGQGQQETSSGQGQQETSSGEGFNYADMIGAFSQAVPSIMNSVSQYNAPIGDNAQYLGDYYVNAKKTFNKNTGILGGLGLLTFTDDISQDLANLENDTAARISAMKAPEATSLDDAMGKLSAFRKQDFSVDNIYSNKYARGFKTAFKGAELGTSISPGWGTLIGAAAGSITGAIGAERNSRMFGKATSAASYALSDKQNHYLAALQNEVDRANVNNMQKQKATISAYGGPLGVSLNPVNNALDYMQNEELLSYRSDDVDSKNKKSSLPVFAFGGTMGGYGGNWSDGLTFVRKGGSHERNPLGGVPMGMAEDGQPNLVEEGEVVWNHPALANGGYVFTKRRNIPKWLQDKYNLGKEPITYAAAVDKLQQAISERPNDPIEKQTLDAQLAEFMGVQEEWRQKKEANDMVKYAANGGGLSRDKDYKSKKKPYPSVSSEDFAGGGRSYPIPTKADAIDALRLAGLHGRSDVKAKVYKKYPELKHALGGHLFDGGGHYDIYGNWIPHNYRINGTPSLGALYNDVQNPDFKEEYKFGITPTFTMPTEFSEATGIVDKSWQPPTTLNFKPEPIIKKQNTYGSNDKGEDLPTSGWQTGLRYAPILGGAIGLAHTLFNKPDYEYANSLMDLADTYANQVGRNRITPRFLGDRLTHNPFDRLFYANELGAQQAGTNRAITNMSNGNFGRTAAALMANNYANNIAMGKLFREGEEYNLTQRQKVAEFNRGTNQYNSEADLKAQMANAELMKDRAKLTLAYKAKALGMKQADDQAYQAALMDNLTNLFDNIGDVGREQYTMDIVRNNPALLYDWLGNYKAKNGGYITIKNRRRK